MEFTKSRYHFDIGLVGKRNNKRKGQMVVNFCILFQIVTINFSSPFWKCIFFLNDFDKKFLMRSNWLKIEVYHRVLLFNLQDLTLVICSVDFEEASSGFTF